MLRLVEGRDSTLVGGCSCIGGRIVPGKMDIIFFTPNFQDFSEKVGQDIFLS